MIYTLRKTDDGRWLVVNIMTEVPAAERDLVLIRMDWQEACDAAWRLNAIATRLPPATVRRGDHLTA